MNKLINIAGHNPLNLFKWTFLTSVDLYFTLLGVNLVKGYNLYGGIDQILG